MDRTERQNKWLAICDSNIAMWVAYRMEYPDKSAHAGEMLAHWQKLKERWIQEMQQTTQGDNT